MLKNRREQDEDFWQDLETRADRWNDMEYRREVAETWKRGLKTPVPDVVETAIIGPSTTPGD